MIIIQYDEFKIPVLLPSTGKPRICLAKEESLSSGNETMIETKESNAAIGL